jgi:hypothetical protein
VAKRKTSKKQPEPVAFEHMPTNEEKQSPYDRIAERVMKAVEEFNGAIKEAHECCEMRVFISSRGNGEERPLRLQPQIYRLTHSTLTFTIKPAVQSDMEWRVVKDPAFKDAAGQGFAAIKPQS